MSDTPPIRVLLADDHTLFRAGIHSLLDTLPGIAFVAEAENGREALLMAAVHQPDVVLMDIAMPDMNGFDATAQLARAFPDARVIMLSMNADRDSVLKALRAGAFGYLVKTADPAELELAVRAVARGERFLSAVIAAQEDIDAALSAEDGAPGGRPLDKLSPRERSVLQLVVEGKSSAEISALLSLSAKTVDTYRLRIRQKLGIDTLSGLVKFGIREGLTSAD